MGNLFSRGLSDEEDEKGEGPDALDAADDKTEPLLFEKEKGLTTIMEEAKGLTTIMEEAKGLTQDGRTYAEVVREGPEKSDWKFVQGTSL
jgi:hypothetical protein